MRHLKGSPAWHAAANTAAYLRQLADLILNAKDMTDGQFGHLVRYALDYGNIEASDIADSFSDQYRLRPSDVNGWAARCEGPKNSQQKKEVLNWIARRLKQQAAVIQKTVEEPVKISV